VTINFKELNPEARQSLEVLAAQFLAEQGRVGKRGPHCFFCGSMEQTIPAMALFIGLCTTVLNLFCKIQARLRRQLQALPCK
jgi:hypothetical protein